jgi:hypothetical protein
MTKITIDENVCQKNGLFALTCTYSLFQQEESSLVIAGS